MKRIVLFSALILAVCTACTGQAKPTDVETTYGSCSPNMAHNSGSVTIKCQGLDPAIAAQIVEVVKQVSVLNRKTATEKNQQLMIKTLKQIQASLETALAEPPIQVNGPIVQTSTGYCSPNIVGNNNTTVCGPQDLEISAQQSAELTRLASEISPNIPRGQITLELEVKNHRTQVAGAELAGALRNAGLNTNPLTTDWYTSDVNNYGGITFENLSERSLPMAKVLSGLLNRLGIVHGPIPFFLSTDAPSADFTIVVRKPE